VKEYQRKQLLERVGRESATVGADIPDEIEIQGERIDLRSFVFEIKRRDTIPEGERERVERAKRNLRRERIERLERIEENRVSFEEGEKLARNIIGIDRALDALEQLRPADLEREAKLQEAQDQKRWMNFLKQALGRDGGGGSDGRRGRGGGLGR
jgi:predicted Zn-dependent peptidase